jgi:hypothetical protein
MALKGTLNKGFQTKQLAGVMVFGKDVVLLFVVVVLLISAFKL